MAGRRHVIAIVEDDPDLRQALARLLSISGFDTEVFLSGADFLKSAVTSKAACIVAQMKLRDGSRSHFARELEAARVQIPVLFINDQTFRNQRVGLPSALRNLTPLDRFLAAIDMAIQSQSGADSSDG